MMMSEVHPYKENPIYQEELIREYARLDEQKRREKIKKEKDKKKKRRKELATWIAFAFGAFMMYKIYVMFTSSFHIILR